MQQPSFDTWTTIFLFAAIQGIFVSVALCFLKKENRRNNLLLALLIFLFSVTLFEYVMYWTHYIREFPHILGISATFPFLFGVIIYFYFRNVFEKKPYTKKDLLHLIPFFIYLIYQLPLYLSTADVKREWLKGNFINASLFSWPELINKFITWYPWLMIIHMTVYAIVIYKTFSSFSKTNEDVRQWFNWLTSLFVLFIISFTSYYVLVLFPFFNNTWDYMISFSMTFFIYFIAWFGYLQPAVFSGFKIKEVVRHNSRYKNSALDTDLSLEILRKLESTLKDQKLYRENDLSLEKLARTISVSKHHLSQVINEQTGMNFFEYINKQRINEATELLSNTSKKELNIIDVAYTVGFNNKVSFNTTFKKMTGKTPTEFRKDATTSSPELKIK